jgi:predicted dehydrogenase
VSIRVGLIGLNYGGQVHLPAFKANPKFDVVAVCARSVERAEAVAREHGIPRWYSDARRLIASRLDLVAIASPPPTHAGFAAAALAAGKHVLVEVGYTGTAADARVLAEMAREHRRVGAAAFAARFVPSLRHVGDVLAQGVLGEPRLMHMDFFSRFLAQPVAGYDWMWDAEHGGGILANFVAHGVDLARRWFGPVLAVDASLATRGAVPEHRAGGAVADDTGQVALHFANGMLATFSFSAAIAAIRTQIGLHGSLGSVLVQGFGDETEILNTGDTQARPLFAPTVYLEATRGETGLLGGLPVLLERLGTAISTGEAAPDLPTLDQALEIQCILEAARQSAREHRRVSIAEVGELPAQID